MTVSLTPELERLVTEKVKTSLSHWASKVMREGLRLLQEQDHLRQLRLEEVKKQVAIGVEQLDRGQRALLDIEQIKAKGRKQLAQKTKGKS